MLTAVQFGRDHHLVGILETSAACKDAEAVVVIPNAGFVNQAGPFRLHVSLSRHLATQGIPCLRFDLSGLGDSVIPARREPNRARKLADIDDAITLAAQQTGATRTIVVGLCSGATDAHESALKSRHDISAIGLLDPVAYPNRLYHWLELTKKLTSPPRIWRQLRRMVTGSKNKQESTPGPPKIHQARPADQFFAELEKITAKGTHCLFVYTGGRRYNHKKQLYSLLSPGTRRSRISTAFYPQCDHTFILTDHRRLVCETVGTWIKDKVLSQTPAEHS